MIDEFGIKSVLENHDIYTDVLLNDIETAINKRLDDHLNSIDDMNKGAWINCGYMLRALIRETNDETTLKKHIEDVIERGHL